MHRRSSLLALNLGRVREKVFRRAPAFSDSTGRREPSTTSRQPSQIRAPVKHRKLFKRCLLRPVCNENKRDGRRSEEIKRNQMFSRETEDIPDWSIIRLQFFHLHRVGRVIAFIARSIFRDINFRDINYRDERMTWLDLEDLFAWR